MTRTIERADGDWLDRMLNRWPLCLHVESIKTLLAVSLFSTPGWGIHREGTRSLFYNGVLFVRVTLPFGVWLHVKPVSWGRFQCGLGWKLNGRAAILFRFQSDTAAARGVSGPNEGQASAWERGTA